MDKDAPEYAEYCAVRSAAIFSALIMSHDEFVHLLVVCIYMWLWYHFKVNRKACGNADVCAATVEMPMCVLAGL